MNFFSESDRFRLPGEKPPTNRWECEQYTHNTARTELHSITTFHHANTRGSRSRIAHLGVLETMVIDVSCLISCRTDTDHTHKFSLSPISSTSLIFPTVSPSQTSLMILNPYTPCDGPRQCGGSTQIPSLAGFVLDAGSHEFRLPMTSYCTLIISSQKKKRDSWLLTSCHIATWMCGTHECAMVRTIPKFLPTSLRQKIIQCTATVKP